MPRRQGAAGGEEEREPIAEGGHHRVDGQEGQVGGAGRGGADRLGVLRGQRIGAGVGVVAAGGEAEGRPGPAGGQAAGCY